MFAKIPTAKTIEKKLDELIHDLDLHPPNSLDEFIKKIVNIVQILSLRKAQNVANFLLYSRVAEWLLAAMLKFKQDYKAEEDSLNLFILNMSQIYLISIKAASMLADLESSYSQYELAEFQNNFDSVFHLYMFKKHGSDHSAASRTQEYDLIIQQAKEDSGLYLNPKKKTIDTNDGFINDNSFSLILR